MKFYPPRLVVRETPSSQAVATATAMQPNVFVSIAVDAAYVLSQQGNTISEGIYMMDNMVSMGSTGEGSMDLVTAGNAGWLIGWNAVAIDPNLPNLGLEITYVQICNGTVFSSPPVKMAGTGYSWIGQMMFQGTQSYNIQIKITEGLSPVSYYLNWEAQVKCN